MCTSTETNSGNSVVTGTRKKSGLIRKYGLNMSRQAFRENAADIGFVKVSASAGRAERRRALTNGDYSTVKGSMQKNGQHYSDTHNLVMSI